MEHWQCKVVNNKKKKVKVDIDVKKVYKILLP